MPKKQYDARKGYGGHWTLDLEKSEIWELSVAETIDCLILKIRNSNGLDFASLDQVQCLIELLAGAYKEATEQEQPKSLVEARALLIRALFSHLGVQFRRQGGLYEVSKTLPVLHHYRELNGLAAMTDGQALTHAAQVTEVVVPTIPKG